MPFELFVAIRYLRSRRKQVMLSVVTAIAVAAVAAGVAALVLVLALMTGFREDMQSRVLAGTAHLNLVRRDNLPISDYRALVGQLVKLPRVTSAVPTFYQTVLFEGTEGAAGAVLKGVDPEAPNGTAEVARFLTEGDVASLATPLARSGGGYVDTMIVGSRLAEEIGLRVGDTVNVTAPGPEVREGRIVPRSKEFRVVGIFESGLYDYDSQWAYISIDAEKRLVDADEVVQVIQMQLDDIYAVKEVADEVLSAVGDRYTTRDWQELNEPLYAALALERLGFFVVLVVVVTIAALNIITLLTMMVMEKTADIGILKSMGATGATIMRIFVYQGLAIGVVGAIVGVAVGAGLAWYFDTYQVISLPPDVYSLSHVSFRLEPLDVALVVVATIAISLLSTIYPARSAARLDPVEALRYE
jgi:lipoprotein-releasing system permease protein